MSFVLSLKYKGKTMYINQNELRDVMEHDVYYALPQSVCQWLSELKISAAERLCFEKMISIGLMNSRKRESSISAKISLTLLASLTGRTKKTAYNVVQSLIKKELISRRSVTEQGGIYIINISREILGKTKKRKATRKTAQAEEQNTATTPEYSDEFHSEKKAIADEHISSEIKDEITSLKNEMEEKQKIMSSLPVRKRLTSPVNKELIKLAHKIDGLQKSLKTLQEAVTENNKKNKRCKKPVSEKNTSNPKNKELPLRRIKVSQIRQVMEKINASKEVTAKGDVINQVIWSIRFGWYRKKPQWPTQNCINHALKMIRNNQWYKPSNYKEREVSGLIRYVKNLPQAIEKA